MNSSTRSLWSRLFNAEALGSRAVIGVPFGWLLLFFLLPFFVVLKISVSESDGIHFKDIFVLIDGGFRLQAKFSNYAFLANDPLYLDTYLRSIKYAAVTTGLCLLIGYPFAYFLARSPAHWRPGLLMMVMLPFWTSLLLRVYAWKGLLSANGLIYEVINGSLMALGLIDEPIKLMNTQFSLIIGMVYTYLPFMIMPLYANLVKMDLRLLEAAADLGARPLTAFFRVTVPLSKSGIIAGAMLVFIPCVGEYVIPELLGGPETLMIGRLLWDEFFANNDWPLASAAAIVMVLLILAPLALFNRYQSGARGQA